MRLEDCPVKAALDVIDGKWKPLILFELKNGPLRFGELLRRLPGATHKVLVEQLRQLEAEDVVDRIVVPDTQAHTEYCLSAYGNTLKPILGMLAEWGAGHRNRARVAVG